jgi:hypothetical protein
MIILQIQIVDFLLRGVDAKCYAPVASDAEAPSSFAVSRQRTLQEGKARHTGSTAESYFADVVFRNIAR